MIVQRALKEGPVAMRRLAEETGISYGVLRAWAAGRRTPTNENLRRLAAGFRQHSDQLRHLADELDRAAEEGEGR